MVIFNLQVLACPKVIYCKTCKTLYIVGYILKYISLQKVVIIFLWIMKEKRTTLKIFQSVGVSGKGLYTS